MKIGFIMLGSWGDCINSTLMFRPLKEHYKDCSITVHTTTYYQSAFYNNPYVDGIVAHQASSKTQCFDLYNSVPATVQSLGYDKVISPAPILHPTKRNSLLHPEYGSNLIMTFCRALEEDGVPYDFPPRTVMRLTDDEVKAVDLWLQNHRVTMAGKKNILMEVHGESGQTFWSQRWTMAVCRHLMGRYGNGINLFISRRDRTFEIDRLEGDYLHRVHWVGLLSVRECAELYNRCDVFFSVSSGLSNACNTDYCKTDKTWIETVNSNTVNSAPIRSAGKKFWYDDDLVGFIDMLSSIEL